MTSASAASAAFFVGNPRRRSCWRLPLIGGRSTTSYRVVDFGLEGYLHPLFVWLLVAIYASRSKQ